MNKIVESNYMNKIVKPNYQDPIPKQTNITKMIDSVGWGSGKWLAFLDSDDYWYRERLQVVSDLMSPY